MTTVALEAIQAGPQTTADSRLVIEMPDGQLPVGQHRFGVTVQDDSGNESAQVFISVVVVDTERPTAVLELRDANGRLLDDNRIPFGATFTLDSRRSTDTGGGQMVTFIWELL